MGGVLAASRSVSDMPATVVVVAMRDWDLDTSGDRRVGDGL